MGVGPALVRALALHDPDSWAFSVEFSLVAVFSFGSRGLRGRSVAPATRITDRGYSGTRSHCRYEQCDANSAYDWFVRFPVDMDLSWAGGLLVSLGGRVARLCTSGMGTRGGHGFCVARDL